MEEDTLKVEENEDGTLSISWDQNDPKYSFLNGLTEAQITAMLEQYLRRITDDESLLDSNE
jgi:hypothetical protein